jgi:hypothetical protein
MKFLITMNMPGNTGRPTHQVICEYPVDSIDGFINALSTNDFLIVDEYYRDPQTQKHFNAGELGLNYRYVGKVKVYDPNHAKNMQAAI